MKQIFFFLIMLSPGLIAQNKDSDLETQKSFEFTFEEYLGYVKKFHPLVKNANLEINKSQANLMAVRGAFDPKIEASFDQKQYKDKNYYSIFNSSFKIPTWYGVEVKAGFDQNEGLYLNPENNIPNQGLASFGISIPLGQGLLINQRMADLRKAKIQLKLSQAERKLQAVEILYNASIAYFNWKRNYEETRLYAQYKINAETRYKGVASLIKQGDKRAIDSIEAGINLTNRKLSLENSTLKLTKAKLELSNFLWLENEIPMEITDVLYPEKELETSIQETLKTNSLTHAEFSIDDHPKINALENKINILNVERKLKANSLLPKINIAYSYLSEPQYIENYKFENYKIGVDFSYPLFLRKERGSLKITKLKLQETSNSLNLERLQLENKINAQKEVINSLFKQRKFVQELVKNHQVMLNSEERLFSLGESSLFIINSRESSLISTQLNEIALNNEFYISNSELYKIMANPE